MLSLFNLAINLWSKKSLARYVVFAHQVSSNVCYSFTLLLCRYHCFQYNWVRTNVLANTRAFARRVKEKGSIRKSRTPYKTQVDLYRYVCASSLRLAKLAMDRLKEWNKRFAIELGEYVVTTTLLIQYKLFFWSINFIHLNTAFYFPNVWEMYLYCSQQWILKTSFWCFFVTGKWKSCSA